MSLFSIEFAMKFLRLNSIFIDFEDIIRINLSISKEMIPAVHTLFLVSHKIYWRLERARAPHWTFNVELTSKIVNLKIQR